MKTVFSRKLQLILCICSVLLVSACTTTTSKTNTNKTDKTDHVTIEKGKFESPPVLVQPVTTPLVVEQAKNVSEAVPNTVQFPKTTTARINPNETFVNVRSAPSIKSRNIAVITAGQLIEILEVKDVWMKVKWQKGDVVKQGWLKKRFVEGYEQNK